MRKIILGLLLLLAFTSCKKEDDTTITKTGPDLVLKSISTTTEGGSVLFTIIFNVTASTKGDLYLDEQAIIAEKTDKLVGGGLASIMVMPNATTIHSGDKNYFLISNGDTQEVMLRVKILNGGNSGFTGVKVSSIKWHKDDVDTNPVVQTSGLEKFKTQLVYIE